MGKIDLTLKSLLSGGAPRFLEAIGVPPRLRFLPGEVYESNELRIDVFALPFGRLTPYIHMELQTTNTALMPIRMMRYQAGAAFRLIKERRHRPNRTSPVPDILQTCVFVGNVPMSMANRASSGYSCHQYRLIDVRTIEARTLSESPSVNDGILSVLCNGGADPENIDRTLERLKDVDLRRQAESFLHLLVLSSFRGVYDDVSRRSTAMGISVDLTSVPEFLRASEELSRRVYRQGEVNFAMGLVRQKLDDEDVLTELKAKLVDMDPDAMTGFVSRLLDTDTPDELIGMLRMGQQGPRPR